MQVAKPVSLDWPFFQGCPIRGFAFLGSKKKITHILVIDKICAKKTILHLVTILCTFLCQADAIFWSEQGSRQKKNELDNTLITLLR